MKEFCCSLASLEARVGTLTPSWESCQGVRGLLAQYLDGQAQSAGSACMGITLSAREVSSRLVFE